MGGCRRCTVPYLRIRDAEKPPFSLQIKNLSPDYNWKKANKPLNFIYIRPFLIHRENKIVPWILHFSHSDVRSCILRYSTATIALFPPFASPLRVHFYASATLFRRDKILRNERCCNGWVPSGTGGKWGCYGRIRGWFLGWFVCMDRVPTWTERAKGG